MADASNTLPDEIWKPVPGWSNYLASSLGRIRGPRRILRPSKTPFGYLRVNLKERGSGKIAFVSVHRLVCAAFLGECPSGLQVNHIDNVRDNNSISNLEYVTPSQNSHHRKLFGTFPYGENNGRSKLTAGDVVAIRLAKLDVESSKKIALRYGVHKNTIQCVLNKDTWKTK